jgi:hypothetical protein
VIAAIGDAIPQGGDRCGRGTLSARDIEVVELVGRFRQLHAEQIRSVMFPTQSSKTPLDRCLHRLTRMGYLARLDRVVGGFGGGSGCYVYQLGRAGWRVLAKGGAYRPQRAVSWHTLTITECFVRLASFEHDGQMTVLAFEPEPSCHLNVAGTALTPDAYVELGVRATRQQYRLWLEIDRGTEHMDTIKGKCVRYWRAYQAWDEAVFPYVVFVVLNASRQREIERTIADGPAAAQTLFRVEQLDTFGEVIHRNLR